MRLISYLTFCSLIILTFASRSFSHSPKSELVSAVRDQNGALVQSAKVTLTEVAKAQTSRSGISKACHRLYGSV